MRPPYTSARRTFRQWLRRAYRDNAALFLMSLPGALIIFVFRYVPMPGIIIAFQRFRYDLGIFRSEWTGFYNFRYLLSPAIGPRILFNTVFMNLLFMIIGTIACIALALLMNEVQGRLRARFYQSALFLPHFVSWVIVSYLVFAILSGEHGALNQLLLRLGRQPVDWYSAPQYWRVILVIVNLWKGVGYGSILYLAVMLGISPELFEAAKIDGASKLQQIWHVTLPLLLPTVVIVLLLSVGGMLRADFGLFYVVTRDSTPLYPVIDVIDTFVYRALLGLGDMGMAAAAGMFQSVAGFVLVILSNWLVRRVDPERSLF